MPRCTPPLSFCFAFALSVAIPALGIASTFTAAVSSTCASSASDTSGTGAAAATTGECSLPPLNVGSTSGSALANSNGLEASAVASVNYGAYQATLSSASSAEWSITGLHLVGSNLLSNGWMELVVEVSGSAAEQAFNDYNVSGSGSGSVAFSIDASANGGAAQTLLSNTHPFTCYQPVVGIGNCNGSYGPLVLTSSLFNIAPGDTDSLSLSVSTNASSGDYAGIDATLELVAIDYYVNGSGNAIPGDSLADDSGDVFQLNQSLIATPEPGTLMFFGAGLMILVWIGWSGRNHASILIGMLVTLPGFSSLSGQRQMLRPKRPLGVNP